MTEGRKGCDSRMNQKEKRAIVIFQIPERHFCCDLDIPLFITADELVHALNEAYHLGIRSNQPQRQYLRAEDPITLLKGTATLEELGIHHGSIIIAPCHS